MKRVSDKELLEVIKDFLEMGHVENIVAMFHQEVRYYNWTGAILDDERFNVRLGVSVLFEELKMRAPEQIERAVDSLLPLLASTEPNIRGEAICVLGIIGSERSRHHITAMKTDPHPQVREVALDVLDELNKHNNDPPHKL